MHATRKDRTAIVFRMLLICMLTAEFLSPAGAMPARAQNSIYIGAFPSDGYIFSNGWQSNSNLTLSIDDPTTGTSPDYIETFFSETGSAEFYPAYNFAKSGTAISVTDGIDVKTMTVNYFEFHLVAYSSGAVSGTGDPGKNIDVELSTGADQFYTQSVTIDGAGNWQAVFTDNSISLIDFGSTIFASISDAEGNPTSASYSVKPFMVARLNINRVLCRGWEPEKTLTLKIGDPDNPDYTLYSDVTQDLGHFTLSRADFKLKGITTLAPGMLLTLSDGYFTRSMTVAPLTLDGIDTQNNILSGTTSPDAQITVMVDQLPNESPSRVMFVTADPGGNWTADFANEFDINYLTEGMVRYFVNDGSYNHTRIEFQVEPATVYDTISANTWGELALDDGSASISVPAGALSNDTGLTIAPQGTDFQVTTDLGAVQPAVNVNIGPNGTQFDLPVTITLAWLDEDDDGIVDGSGLAEAGLYVFKDGVKIAGPCSTDSNCDPVNNLYALQVASLSDFVVGGLVQVTPSFESLTGPLAAVKIGVLAQVSAVIANPPSGVYPVSFNWGDGATSTVSASGASVNASHTYTAPGVYSVAATISGSGFDPVTAVYNYIVVYDPNGGFVIGGGIFMSPAGAYLADPGLKGKMAFAFASKYRKGASLPDGNTVLKLQTGKFIFVSESYEWLVVKKGSQQVQFKGQGRVNGKLAPNGKAYQFIIWATDGKTDTLRIKVWWENASGEQVIYDNGVENAILSGSIVVSTN